MWKSLNDDDVIWRDLIQSQKNTTYFHDIEWANHLRNNGWITSRWILYEDGNPKNFLQGFIKKYPLGVGVLWFPDWASGELTDTKHFQNDIVQTLGLSYIYIRFCSRKNFNIEDHDFLIKNNWSRPSIKFTTGLTMELKLSSKDEFRSNLKRNWRRNLKKSENLDLSYPIINNHQVVSKLYQEMKVMKSLSNRNIFSAEVIKSIFKNFKDKMIVIGAKDLSGNIVAIRAAIIHKKVAWDIFAATGKNSRKDGITHGIFSALIEECVKRGCVKYDLSGIDPLNNRGVFKFKEGTGAYEKEYLGEFEWSNNKLLSFLVNHASKYR